MISSKETPKKKGADSDNREVHNQDKDSGNSNKTGHKKEKSNNHDYNNGVSTNRKEETTNLQHTNNKNINTQELTGASLQSKLSLTDPQHKAVNGKAGAMPSPPVHKEVIHAGILKRTPAEGM